MAAARRVFAVWAHLRLCTAMNETERSAADAAIRSADPTAVRRALEAYAAWTIRAPGDATAWFERGGAHDYLGQEEVAIGFYDRVRGIGIDALPESDRPKFYLQAGSTLRNLRRYAESRALLAEGMRRHPDFAALGAFLALTEYTDGNFRAAAKLWLDALLAADDSVVRYGRALRGYRDALDAFPDPPRPRGS